MGGSGFVGRAVVRALLDDGHELFLLNRGNRPVARTHQITADRNDGAALAAAVDGFGAGFDALVDTNCYTGDQVRRITQLLRGRVPRAVVISSAAVYRDGHGPCPDETAPIGGGAAWGDYGRDKSAVEAAYHGAGFASCQILRPPYVFGPDNDLDRETWFLRRLAYGRPLLVPGRGTAICQFLHQDDLGKAVALCLARGPEGVAAFNLAQPERMTLAQLARLFARLHGAGHGPGHGRAEVVVAGTAGRGFCARDWFPFRDVDCAVAPGAFMTAFGWRPPVPLHRRFAEVVETLRQRRATETDTGWPDDWTGIEETILRRHRRDSLPSTGPNPR